MLIKIQKLWPAHAKYTSFKGDDGRDYKGEADLYEKITEGMTIDPPSVKPSEWTDQKGNSRITYWLPKGFDPNTVGAIIPQQIATPNGQSGPNNQPNIHIPAPPRQNGNGNRADGFRSPSQMFLCEVAAAYFGTGKADISEAPEVLRILREAWDLHG